jgi:hypothetical protein
VCDSISPPSLGFAHRTKGRTRHSLNLGLNSGLPINLINEGLLDIGIGNRRLLSRRGGGGVGGKKGAGGAKAS